MERLNVRLFPNPDDSVLEDTHRANQWITRSGRAVRLLAYGLAEAAADESLAGDAEVRLHRLLGITAVLMAVVAWRLRRTGWALSDSWTGA